MNFGLNPVGGGLSLVRILESVSRTLGIVRQVSPIIREIKPLFVKAPEFFRRLSGLQNTVRTTRERLASPMNETTIQESAYQSTQNGGPVFFQ